MPNEKRIIGAVGVGNKTFTAGMEEEFEAAVAASDPAINLDRLEKKGVIKGYGKQTAEAMQTINRQRKADGSRADEAAVEAADAEVGAEATTTEAPKAVAKKAAPKRKR